MEPQTEIVLYGDGFERTPVGLLITGKPSFDEWLAAGKLIWRDRNSFQWVLGDWLLYGEGRGDWGETYTQGIKLTDYSVQTLKNACWVNSRFEMSRRRTNLSRSHHEVVASLEPILQDRLLDLAVQYEWSRDELRDEVRRIKATLDDNAPDPEPPTLPPGDDDGEQVALVRVPVEKIRGIPGLDEQLAGHELNDSEIVILKVIIPNE